MKKISITLLSFLLITSCATFNYVPQNNEPFIEKGNNTIILLSELSSQENYNLILNYLLENDYNFERRDSELFTIKTDPKTSFSNVGQQSSGHHIFKIRCVDNKIIIKIDVETPTFGGSGNIWNPETEYMEWFFAPSKQSILFWNWYYNFKPLFEQYPNKISMSYITKN